MNGPADQSIDRYQITGLLGEGGMGTVYKAYDPRLKRHVAVKVMHSNLSRNPIFRERFFQEGVTAASLNHPGIVTVYDSGEAAGNLYIVMELIPGENLREMLSQLQAANRVLFLSEAVQLTGEICMAVDYTHHHNVLHRDIKPDNVLLKPDPTERLPYQPVLTDLGLAKLLEELSITRPGEVLGTPAYMSPEQAEGFPVDSRSDVYSLAILLYELVTRRLPFPAKTPSEARRFHIEAPLPIPSSQRPGIPEALEQVILRGLAKKPENRFQSAREMAKALLDTLPALQASEAKEGHRRVASQPAPVGLQELYAVKQDLPEAQGEDQQTELVRSRYILRIHPPNQPSRTIPILPGSLTIGREASNDLQLEDQKVSPYHARLDFSGGSGEAYHIIDLGSEAGTYLAGTRLPPNHPLTWKAGQSLQMGDTWMYIEEAQPLLEQNWLVNSEPPLDQSRILTSMGGGGIGVYLEKNQFVVVPGESLGFSIIVLNQGPLVAHYLISITGIPTEWVLISNSELHLMPAGKNETGRAEVNLAIQPPRAPQSRAGNHPFAIRVETKTEPKDWVEAPATLAISPYYLMELDLHPKKLRTSREGIFRAHISNRGNADLTVELQAEDPEESCEYLFASPCPVVSAGADQEVQITVRPKVPLRNEQHRSFSFTLTARAVEAPDLDRQAYGEWVEEPAPLIKPEIRWDSDPVQPLVKTDRTRNPVLAPPGAQAPNSGIGCLVSLAGLFISYFLSLIVFSIEKPYITFPRYGRPGPFNFGQLISFAGREPGFFLLYNNLFATLVLAFGISLTAVLVNKIFRPIPRWLLASLVGLAGIFISGSLGTLADTLIKDPNGGSTVIGALIAISGLLLTIFRIFKIITRKSE